eukprot:TRINITY_DN998_c0_g1_i5.p1 TRINITY_DN998_c0_g1~~TRINITY_DN998_c0_g1_i5.p1  ORF type:complete len:206 (-),score=4.50 TRINITY_DN998_c0_g1_i5:48-665(-)
MEACISMLFKSIRQLLLTSLVFFSASSYAVIIEYEVTSLGGNSYMYDYKIINDDIAAGVEEIGIYFDVSLFENLAVAGSPADWSSFVLQPDPLLPADGLFGSFFLVSPLGLGEMLDGFSVTFDFLGAAAGPGSQFFEIYDFNFDVVGAGNTVSAFVPPSVPEPGSLALLLLGLGIAARYRTKSGCQSLKKIIKKISEQKKEDNKQ